MDDPSRRYGLLKYRRLPAKYRTIGISRSGSTVNPCVKCLEMIAPYGVKEKQGGLRSVEEIERDRIWDRDVGLHRQLIRWYRFLDVVKFVRLIL